MKKGQGAPKRKTVLEAKYGAAAEGDVGRHLDLLYRYESSKAMLGLIEYFLSESEPGVTPEHVEAKQKEISSLAVEMAEASVRIRGRPEILGKLTRIAEQTRATAESGKSYIEGAVFDVEWAVLTMYQCGVKDYGQLFALAEEIRPGIKPSTFSKIVKRYKLDLKKRKPGPQPGTAKRSGRKR